VGSKLLTKRRYPPKNTDVSWPGKTLKQFYLQQKIGGKSFTPQRYLRAERLFWLIEVPHNLKVLLGQ